MKDIYPLGWEKGPEVAKISGAWVAVLYFWSRSLANFVWLQNPDLAAGK